MVGALPPQRGRIMATKHWLSVAAAFLAVGLLYVHLHAAPVPEPVARGQPGRYTVTRVTLVRTDQKGRQLRQEHQVLLDTATGKLWALEEQGQGKEPRNKWVLAAEAPK